ncbi:MAG: hypothetical protein M3066_09065 [Actinomycetota bacterium]|nr:hypothetical protein [Actinomycetota bacterium]
MSLTAEGNRPPSLLPNDPTSASIPATICSFKAGGLEDQIGYVTARVAGNRGPVLAYGFVPSRTVSVTLTMRNRGFLLFRLLKPTDKVNAQIYGASLGLPVTAWEGPDLSGYSVTKIQARDKSGSVISSITYGQ